jgi:hypothetical protein
MSKWQLSSQRQERISTTCSIADLPPKPCFPRTTAPVTGANPAPGTNLDLLRSRPVQTEASSLIGDQELDCDAAGIDAFRSEAGSAS